MGECSPANIRTQALHWRPVDPESSIPHPLLECLSFKQTNDVEGNKNGREFVPTVNIRAT